MTEVKNAGFDADKFAHNMTKVYEESGKQLANWLNPPDKKPATEMNDAVKTLGKVAEYWLADPERAIKAQTDLFSQYMSLWNNTAKAFAGEKVDPVAMPAPRDNRFKAEEWSGSPLYDFIKQFYLITADWTHEMADNAELDPHMKHKAAFYSRQLTAALSPSNFAATNPEVVKKTIETSGDNLVRGLKMLSEDLERGKGTLKIRQSDDAGFEVGVNMATTLGSVVFRNDLIELIQYKPSTPSVSKIPLLIVPPWINKFYILDLNPEKSFIKWCVAQGLTVFCVSWVNPDARLAEKSFENYMFEGILAALEQVLAKTNEKEAHLIGYCVGGTLLASTMGYMAAKKDKRIKSATFFTTQTDFTDAGDLKVFVDEEQIQAVENKMEGVGYLAGSSMANAFNMLRANDLIWPYVVKNYLKGDQPMPFDLLYWNADSTRMPAANHSFYLRQCYLNNNLAKGLMELAGVKIDLSKVKVPVYNLAAREDHIAPARSAFKGSSLFGGDVEYVMGGSGHIAGVVNPPYKPKYQYWTGGKPIGDFNEWVASATETAGSWWPHWRAWIEKHDGKEVSPREPVNEICPAPGEYVRIKD
jgi:polyhydroxyalkanoate synthase subunit PhaC